MNSNTGRIAPTGVVCLIVSFRPAIPRQVAPQQSLPPLRRRRQCTSITYSGTIAVPVNLSAFLCLTHGVQSKSAKFRPRPEQLSNQAMCSFLACPDRRCGLPNRCARCAGDRPRAAQWLAQVGAFGRSGHRGRPPLRQQRAARIARIRIPSLANALPAQRVVRE